MARIGRPIGLLPDRIKACFAIDEDQGSVACALQGKGVIELARRGPRFKRQCVTVNADHLESRRVVSPAVELEAIRQSGIARFVFVAGLLARHSA